MFASFVLAHQNLRYPIRAAGAAGLLCLAGVTQAVAQPVCRPVIAFTEVRFSPVQPETQERRWTALLSVDASRCATTSGRFEIVFSRLKENAPDMDFVEPFTWTPGSMEVSVDFWADEAVDAYGLYRVGACPCRE